MFFLVGMPLTGLRLLPHWLFEASGRYPAYVFYHTDFSSGRKEMLKHDLATSSDEAQIRAIFTAEIEANVKKGWLEV